MRFPRAMSKINSQECSGQNYIQTHGTATASTDASKGTCTDASKIPFTDIHTCRSTSKDVRGSTCTDDLGSACTDFSTENTDVHRSMCLYIPTKYMGVHVVTSMDNSTVNTVVHARTNVHDDYGRYKPISYIGTDVVRKVRNGVSYDDSLQQGSWVLIKL